MKLSERATASSNPPVAAKKPCTVCGTIADEAHVNRSTPHLRRYFALIRATYHHWPENHDRAFTNSEECRAYLQIKAGHRTIVATIPLAGIKPQAAMIVAEAAMRAAGSNAVPDIQSGQLVIYKPRSIAFGKLSHADAVGLFAEVEDVIRAETGLDPAQLMLEENVGHSPIKPGEAPC